MARIGEVLNEPEMESMSDQKTVNVPKDDPEAGVDTAEFLKDKLVLGSEFVPKLKGPLLPGDAAPTFTAQGLEGGVVKNISLADYKVNLMSVLNFFFLKHLLYFK